MLLKWFEAVPDTALHLSVLTLGEIRKGVESVAGASRKEKLRLWREQELPAWFEDRLLPVDAAVADRWGRLVAEAGRPVAALEVDCRRGTGPKSSGSFETHGPFDLSFRFVQRVTVMAWGTGGTGPRGAKP